MSREPPASKITLQHVAQWAEIIASIAVVLSLVFIMREVQENTRAMQRQVDLDRSTALTSQFFEAPELATVMAKMKETDGLTPYAAALMERYGLTGGEAVLWERHMWGLWLGLEADFERSGRSPQLETWFVALTRNPDGRLYWENQIHSNPAFITYVEEVLASAESAGSEP